MSAVDRRPAAALLTLGCKVNQCDTEALAEGLRSAGWSVIACLGPEAEAPDVIVVNSCAVTARAAAKSRQLTRSLARKYPASRVVLAGCYAQVSPREAAAVAGVAAVAGTARDETLRLIETLAATTFRPNQSPPAAAGLALPVTFEDLPAARHPGRVRAFLKVQEGCDARCAYCVVPLARGSQRSRPLAASLAAAAGLIRSGAAELVLTGIHLGAYGRDLGGGLELAHLVQGCLDLPGLARLRLSSLEPADVSEHLLQTLAASPLACNHLHIPLQSGSDYVLRRMGRDYDAAAYAALLARVRLIWPGVAISTDVMAGFPGETGSEFEETLHFVRRMGFMRLHVFPYSARPGTAAASFPGQVAREVKDERARVLTAEGRRLALCHHRSLVGSLQEVLVESIAGHGGSQPGFGGEGLTRGYVRAELALDEACGPGCLLNVRVIGASAGGVRGEAAAAPAENDGRESDER